MHFTKLKQQLRRTLGGTREKVALLMSDHAAVSTSFVPYKLEVIYAMASVISGLL
jgi:hypothetical protein